MKLVGETGLELEEGMSAAGKMIEWRPFFGV